MNTLASGHTDKQLGLALTEANNQALVRLARAIAKDLCAKYGSCTIDQIRQDERIKEFTPSSPNLWGSVFMGEEWECVGYEPSQLPSNHSRRIARWAYRGACCASILQGRTRMAMWP